MNKPVNNDELARHLEQESGIVECQLLQPHYQRDALIICGTGMDIISVGVQIATDNQDQVRQWISDQRLVKPTPQQVEQWQRDNPRFRSLVVAPFVLMQSVNH